MENKIGQLTDVEFKNKTTMKTIKIVTESHGIVTIDVTNVTNADDLENELIAKYGKFIQLNTFNP